MAKSKKKKLTPSQIVELARRKALKKRVAPHAAAVARDKARIDRAMRKLKKKGK